MNVTLDWRAPWVVVDDGKEEVLRLYVPEGQDKAPFLRFADDFADMLEWGFTHGEALAYASRRNLCRRKDQ